MCHRQQPRGAVHLVSGVAPVAVGRLSGVQGHADREVDGAVVSQMFLGLDCRGGRVGWSREHRAHAVAIGVENVAAVAFDRAPHDGVVDAQRLGHGRRVFLPAARRVSDVGEQEGHCSRWEPAAHARTVTRRRLANRATTCGQRCARSRCSGAGDRDPIDEPPAMRPFARPLATGPHKPPPVVRVTTFSLVDGGC